LWKVARKNKITLQHFTPWTFLELITKTLHTEEEREREREREKKQQLHFMFSKELKTLTAEPAKCKTEN
jgi:hypothetical protein